MAVLRITVLLVALGAQAASPQVPERSYDFRLWHIETDGSRRAVGTLCGGGSADADLRIWLRPSRRLARSTPYRLEADLVLHSMADSTLLIGDITAAHAVAPETGVAGIDSVVRTRLNEETYRRSIVLRGDQAAWFYPFGEPHAGEHGLVLEIARNPRPRCVIQADSLAWRRRPDRVEVAIGNYGITVADRLHRARLRLEVGDPTRGWRRAYEGDALTRMPLRIDLGPDGARGQDLIVELDAPEWGVPDELQDGLCWRWFWADRQPPAGGSCAPTSRGTSVQRLYGSRAGFLRVTILSAR